jgi:hypothetical protein
MTKPTKTLRQREEELRDKLQTPQGRAELEDLAKLYALDGAGQRTPKTSVVTYIRVYERVSGRITA